MPGKGYATIGLKHNILSSLRNATDKYYPGMFLPSTLIIMMNEIRLGYYSVETHNVRLDFSGRYNTLTIRSDIKEWLEQSYEALSEEYEKKYHVKCFSKFVNYYIANILESKFDSQNHVIRLKESDFQWLQDEYKKRKQSGYEVTPFERFADSYIKEILAKVKSAREILTF